jgi:hypothetical protein
METIIEKTTKKLNLKPVKDLIKSYEEKQKFYKRQRKSDKTIFKERQIDPKEAQYKAYWNAKELRVFYAAYGLLRGKKLSQVEQSYTGDITYFEKHGHEHFFDSHKGKIEKTLEGMKQMSEIKE